MYIKFNILEVCVVLFLFTLANSIGSRYGRDFFYVHKSVKSVFPNTGPHRLKVTQKAMLGVTLLDHFRNNEIQAAGRTKVTDVA